MATLTPGVLLKLLQSMNTDAKVTGEHRSAVLQVTALVPALSGSGDLWPQHGFYLQLSDSLNSTFVSLSDSDAASVLSDRPQLGHFVLLDRLLFDPSSPVPRALGLRSLPVRPHPFLGSPQPLVVNVSPSHHGFIIQTASSDHPPPPLTQSKPPTDTAKPPDASKRRLPSPAPPRASSPAPPRTSSPAPGKVNSRPSSPVPSKCEVPSLVAAKEENRRASREPAIVVPSRYRQPSPVGGRKASPMGRRASASPGRRFSGLFKVSPMASGEGGSKKKASVVVAGISMMADVLVGGSSAVRAGRKSWDDGSVSGEGVSSGSSSDNNKKGSSKVKLDKESILRTQVAMSRRLSDVSSKHSNEENILKNVKQSKNETPVTTDKKARALPKITVHDRKWTDGSVPFDTVSDNLMRLGKESMQRKNAAFTAAVEALEEASASEFLVRYLSMFCDLCSSSKAWRPLPTIDRFLTIYADVLGSATIVEALASRRASDKPDPPTERYKTISLWLEAALATDLQVVSLLSHPAPEFPLLEARQQPLPKRNSIGNPSRKHINASSPRLSCSNSWTRGCGVEENVELARTLSSEMEAWFVKFVEQALDAGFQLLGSCEDGSTQDNGKVAAVLSQLKRVNEWLDAVGRRKKEDASTAESIERLKRKIYGFVIKHVGSAFDSSVQISSSVS